MFRRMSPRRPALRLAALSLPVLFAACARAETKSAKEAPVKVTKISGSALSRVEITPKAAERLGIRTAPVSEAPVARTRTVGAQVVAGFPTPGAAGPPAAAFVRVRLNDSDFEAVDRSYPASVVPAARRFDPATAVRLVDPPGSEAETGAPVLYYAPDTAGHGLAPGQQVFVELTLAGAGVRKLIPYSALLYDLEGEAWVYTMLRPLTFERYKIVVEYVQSGRDLAVLVEGPPTGTQVVVAGAAELYGAESGIGYK